MRYKCQLLRYLSLLNLLLIVNYCCSQFHQEDYHIVNDHIDIDDINKTHVESVQIAAYKYNDTLEMKPINISIVLLQDIKEKILLTSSILKFVADEYRAIPFNHTIDLCEVIKLVGHNMNPFGVQTALEMSNFRGCPIVAKKRYHVENWIVEEENSPPHLPPGQYSLKVVAYVDDNIYLLQGSWYGYIVARKDGKKKRRNRNRKH